MKDVNIKLGVYEVLEDTLYLQDIQDNSSLKLDLDLDSLDLIELGLDLETKFNIEISTKALESLNCVEDIIKLIKRRKNACSKK